MSGNGTANGGGSKKLSAEDLRFLFVQFLFGLAAAEVGIKASDLFLKSNLFPSPAFWALGSHLLLAMALIGTSWVGWSNSSSSSAVEPVKSVFSKSFLILLIDVLLVVLYYMLVRSTGLTGEDQSKDSTTLISVASPTFLILLVFGLYLIWDLLTKFDKPKVLLGRGKWTLLCSIGAFCVWWFLREAKSFVAVELTYLSLLLIDVSFRAFKDPGTEPESWIEGKQILGWVLFFAMIISAMAAHCHL